MQRTSIRRFTAAIALPALLALGGCATMDRNECLSANWRQIGYTDGARGLPSRHIEKHAKACAEHQVQVNLDEYLAGRRQGLLAYCTPDNGFVIGRSGERDIATDCPDHLRHAFMEQYNRGMIVHAIESELESAREHVAQQHRRLRQNEKRIDEIRRDLDKKDLPAERRKALLDEYKRLVDDKERLLRHAARHEEDAERLERRLVRQLREFGR